MNIAVLFGGCSPEYGVSLESASSVLSHIDRGKYTPVMVGLTPDGGWYHYTGSISDIAEDKWFQPRYCTPALISPDRRLRALLVFELGGIREIRLDAVFPVLHGKNGEDGAVQGLCELSGLPLVGCGTLASALCMDKDRAHKLAEKAGVAVPRSFLLGRDWEQCLVLEWAAELGYPIFVKPVKSGSSFGVSKVSSPEELPEAVRQALKYDDQAMVEQAIPGFETGCAVMGGDRLITGEIDEIELGEGFFDFTEKYNLITSSIHVPARISPEHSEELKRTAKTIYRALGCSGFARVDMFLTPDGRIVFNEVNTIPGFTAHSRFPSMMRAAGMSFDQVISKAIELAVEQ